MAPTLEDGDWLLVDAGRHEPAAGEVVVVRDPRDPGRLLVKRVIETLPDGSLVVAGDHPAHRDDAGSIGRVGSDLVIGRPWLRYWPPFRFGRIY